MEISDNKLLPYTAWSTRQVISWLRGLDDLLEPYLSEFEAKGITGKWLNSVTPEELMKLGVVKIGHQMIIMDRIRQLQIQYASFDNENMQVVLFRVSRSCVCLVAAVGALMSISERQDCRDPDSDSVYPGILDDIRDAASYILNCVLTLMSVVVNAAFWLERPPFNTFSELTNFRQVLIESALVTNRHAQLAITTQDSSHFKEMLSYVESLRTRIEEVVHTFSDSVMYTPCGMELVQIRKVDHREFGFNFCSKQNNIHVIVAIQNESPAFRSGKLGKGDEVVEVNDQVVIGWQHRRVANLMRLDPKRITMRLRKRPAHATDFTGFPGGGRRHRLLVPQSPDVASPSQQTRSNFLLARTPRRRTPLTAQLIAEPLSGTPEAPDHQLATTPTSISTRDASSYSLSSSSSSSQCPSVKLNDLLQAIPNDISKTSDYGSHSFPAIRMIASTPSTPLMVARSKVESEKGRSSGLGTSSTGSRDGSCFGDTSSLIMDPDACALPKASEPSPVTNYTLPRLGPTHRRAASGGHISLPGSIVKEAEQAERASLDHPPVNTALISGKCQTLDKRSRNRLFVGSLEDIGRLGKLVFGQKRTTRLVSCEDLGNGECQGWLWLKKSNTFSSKYVKRWCVFKHSTMYYYRNPEDPCAEGLINMHGFTITPAPETKSARFPFHVFNELVRFVFASESKADQSKWINILHMNSELHQPHISGFNSDYPADAELSKTECLRADDTRPLDTMASKRSLSPDQIPIDRNGNTSLSTSLSANHRHSVQTNRIWFDLKQTPPTTPVVKSPVAVALLTSSSRSASLTFRRDGWSTFAPQNDAVANPPSTEAFEKSQRAIDHDRDSHDRNALQSIGDLEKPSALRDRQSPRTPTGSLLSPVNSSQRPTSASPQPNTKSKVQLTNPSDRAALLVTPILDRRRRSQSPASNTITKAHAPRSHHSVFTHKHAANHWAT